MYMLNYNTQIRNTQMNNSNTGVLCQLNSMYTKYWGSIKFKLPKFFTCLQSVWENHTHPEGSVSFEELKYSAHIWKEWEVWLIKYGISKNLKHHKVFFIKCLCIIFISHSTLITGSWLAPVNSLQLNEDRNAMRYFQMVE